MTILNDFIENKETIIVGTGVGERSRINGYYYANINSNCLWSVLKRKKWINDIPNTSADFEKIIESSDFGFTDLVKDYSGNDNKVLQKYFKLNEKNKININPKYLIKPELLKHDIDSLISKLHDKNYVIINGKPLMKILCGKDNFEYGIIENKKILQSIGIKNSKLIFMRNTVIRNAKTRQEVETKIIEILKIID
jgi:hypothetical protein